MARPLRIEFENATYHVMSRGNRRDVIVRDDRDRGRWLEWLERVAVARQWRLMAYGLLDNHFHLFVRTPLANLSAGMQTLNGSYTSYYNRRHRLAGHLFQGRYKAHLVEDGRYADTLSRYIHLNPVRAGACARPEQWPWSSCAGYYRAARARDWIDYGSVLEPFGGPSPVGRRRYRRFVEAGLADGAPSPLVEATHGLLLGGEAWVSRMRRQLRQLADPPRQTPTFGRAVRVPADVIADAVAAHYGVSRESLSRRHASHAARLVFAHLSRRLGQLTLRELAPWLGLKSSTGVHTLLSRCEDAIRRSRALTADVSKLKAKLAET